jgi:hypothetical protein
MIDHGGGRRREVGVDMVDLRQCRRLHLRPLLDLRVGEDLHRDVALLGRRRSDAATDAADHGVHRLGCRRAVVALELVGIRDRSELAADGRRPQAGIGEVGEIAGDRLGRGGQGRRTHAVAPPGEVSPVGTVGGPARPNRAACEWIRPAHRFDAAAFAAGGNTCNPSILGIGADSGHHEHRSPNTSVATEASG